MHGNLKCKAVPKGQTVSVPLNLNEHIFPVSSRKLVDMWFEQIGEQHAYNHYLTWLDVPQLTCLIPSL